MKKSSFSIFPIVVAGVCLAVFVLTAEAIKIDHPKYIRGSTNTVPGRYIIGFSGKSQKDGQFFTQSVHKEFKNVNVKVKEDFNHDLFRGVSVAIDTSDEDIHAKALKNILDRSDVASVRPVRLIPRPKAILEKKKKGKKEPSILPHSLTQVDKVHSKLKNKGKGILVGVIDTGVDYLHPALGGGFGKGFKVTKGFDLVGDDYTGDNTPHPDSDPLDDCGAESGASGHGTHVSGIIAGYDKVTNFTGVAPEASLGQWRVFGCDGMVTNDIVIKALLMAYDAGCDVINLSLGETNSWSVTNDAEADVVNRVVAKGVSVVISAGNSGAQGISTVGQPSTSANAFSVASIENGYFMSKKLTATGVDNDILYTSDNDDDLKDGPVVSGDKTPGNSAEGCKADSISPDVKGKLALIQRGTCEFSVKVNNAVAGGAIGVVLYNNVDGAFSASVPGVTVPVISLNNANGQAIIAAAKKGEVVLKFNKEATLQPIENGGTISSFSSLGASAELNFKPNIAGIGGNVFSTMPRYLDSWGSMSGTSMSAPYVAGSVALYLKANEKSKNSIPFVNEHFQNNAKPVKIYRSTDIDSPIRQGAGLVQVYDTILQKSHISPGQISFKDTSSTKYRTKTLTITNRGSKTISYEVVNDVSTAISPYNVKESGYTPLEPAKNSVAAAKLRFSSKSFKLAPGKSKKIKVTVTPPKTNPKNHVYYGGYIHVKSKQQKQGKDLKVPYFGVVGLQKTLPIFDKGFPTIIDTKDKEYGVNDTFVFDRTKKNSFPIAILRLLTPTAKIKAELYNYKTSKKVGEFLTDLVYLGRNFLAEDQYKQYEWNGTYVPASMSDVGIPIPVPSGTYQFRYSALKSFGNPKNKKDWEVRVSGPIVVKN